MELSPLLIVGIVLLVVVAGLTLWQRTQQFDRSAAGRPGASLPAPRVQAHATDVPTGSDPPPPTFWTDPVIGAISFDDGVWITDEDVEFGDTTVIVEVTGTAAGVTDAQRDVVRAALDPQLDLDRRARELIRQELDRKGIGDSEMEPYELAVRPGPDGREAAYLWYEVTEADREMGVSSTDRWRTLALEVLD